MPKNKKNKKVKPVYNDGSCNIPLNWDIIKVVDESKKINPKDVFIGYKGKSKSK